MAITFGPNGNGGYLFPADDVSLKNLGFRKQIMDAGGKYEKGAVKWENHYVLPFETEDQKEQVEILSREWALKFREVHPRAFTIAGGQAGQETGNFHKQLGATRVNGIDGKFYGWTYNEREGYAPADERFALASALLNQDLEVLAALSPDSPARNPRGTANFDKHATYVRFDLAKMGGAPVKRGNETGWVFAPNGNATSEGKLDAQAWEDILEEASNKIFAAAFDRGPLAERHDQVIAFILSEPLLKEAALQSQARTFADVADLNRNERYTLVRKASNAYSKLVAEYERMDKAFQEDKSGPITEEMVTGAEKLLIKGDDGKIMRTLTQAAIERMGEQKIQAGVADVSNVKNDQQLEEKAKGKTGESRIKEASGAYAEDQGVKSAAKALGMNDPGIARMIEAFKKDIDGGEIIPFIPMKPFVAEGPVVAFNKDYILQAVITHRGGVDNVEFMRHERAAFLDAKFTAEGMPTNFTDYEIGAKRALYTEAASEDRGSVSAGDVFKNGDDATLEKLVNSGQNMYVGSHAGVLVALRPSKLKAQVNAQAATVDGPNWEAMVENPTKDIALEKARQDILVKQIVKEVKFAANGYDKNAYSFTNLQRDIEKTKHAKSNSIEDVASFEQRLENLKTSAKEVEEKGMPKLVALHEAATLRAKEAFAEAAPVQGRSTGVPAHTANVPPPLKGISFQAEQPPIHGKIARMTMGEELLFVESFSITKGARPSLDKPDGKHYVFSLDEAGPGMVAAARFLMEKKIAGPDGEKVYRKDKNGNDLVAQPITIGSVPVDSGMARLVVTRDIWPSQAVLDQKYEQTKSRSENEAPRQERGMDRAKDSDLYSGQTDKINAQENSNRTERLKDTVLAVQKTVAEMRGIDVKKVIIDNRAKNPAYDEMDAMRDSGIVVSSLGVAHPAFDRESMGVTDLTKLNWHEANVIYTSNNDADPSKQNDKNYMLTFYDKSMGAQRIVVCEGELSNEVKIANSEELTESGKALTTHIEYGQKVLFAEETLPGDREPIIHVQVIDNELEEHREKMAQSNGVSEIAKERMNKAFGLDAETQKKYIDNLAEVGVENVKSLKEIPLGNVLGRAQGTLVPMMDEDGKKWVMMMKNAQSYQKQLGKLEYYKITDDDIVSKVHTPLKTGENGLGAKGTVTINPGQKPTFDMVLKSNIELEANDQKQAEEIRESVRESRAAGASGRT